MAIHDTRCTSSTEKTLPTVLKWIDYYFGPIRLPEASHGVVVQECLVPRISITILGTAKEPFLWARQRRTMKTVLFLCTGNYYRSRFAEILFNWQAAQQNLPWRADSRGLALDPRNLGPMSEFTINRLGRLELPIEDYLRLPMDLSVDDLNTAHHVVAVKESEHRPLISRRFPQWLDKFEFWMVDDIDCARPDEALPHLEKEVMSLLERLKHRS